MKKKNWLLGIAPLFALAAILCKGIIPNEIRIGLATVAFTLFIIYIVMFVIKNSKGDSENG